MRMHYRMFADYNDWANHRLYDAVSVLSDAQLRESKGAFFGSLHATLNHVLAADRIWMKRFTGTGDAPTTLDAILCADFDSLRENRLAEDRRIVDWIAGLSDADLDGHFTYTPVSVPTEITQRLAPSLSHVFNHQTHHRGQCHMTLTALGGPSLALDMSYFLRDPQGIAYAA